MERHLMLVLGNASDGRDAEFNEWYDDRHLVDVLAIEGVKSARRYALSPVQRYDDTPYRYLAIYEIETDDLAGVIGEVRRRAGTDAMPLSDAMARERLVGVFQALHEDGARATA